MWSFIWLQWETKHILRVKSSQLHMLHIKRQKSVCCCCCCSAVKGVNFIWQQLNGRNYLYPRDDETLKGREWNQDGEKEISKKVKIKHKKGTKKETPSSWQYRRQAETQRARQSFRINTSALRVTQEEILFFDVKSCDPAAAWGIEAQSKRMSTPLTPSRSTCASLFQDVVWRVHVCKLRK